MPQDATATIMMYFVMPLWLLVGFADWLTHRATNIERTSGSRESVFHLILFAEMGAPLLAALFLDVNSLIIAFMIVMFILHEMTTIWDVSYAERLRRITPIEQHVHSFLEVIPLLALCLIVARHWPQFLALFGLGSEASRWGIGWKPEGTPLLYAAAVLAGAAFVGALYLEELARGLRAEGRAPWLSRTA
jgi:hypothetical protein